jgi:predicted GIY-YIG superfamily endonuclease
MAATFCMEKEKVVAILEVKTCLFEENPNYMSRVTYRVYVVELSKKVFTENAKFRAANPQFNGVLECLYVGMTSKTPAERLKQHKTGYVNKKGHKISANVVEKYGIYLRPSLYERLNEKIMNREQALAMEKKLALDLRRQGYAVWFN